MRALAFRAKRRTARAVGVSSVRASLSAPWVPMVSQKTSLRVRCKTYLPLMGQKLNRLRVQSSSTTGPCLSMAAGCGHHRFHARQRDLSDVQPSRAA